MKEKIYRLFSGNVLMKGSLIILVGSVAGNIGTYLYHLVMGRLLGPVDYGVLESLISLNYFLGIPVGVLGLVIVRYVSSHKDDKKAISLFSATLVKKLLSWGFGMLLLFLVCFPLLKNLLKVDSFYLFLGVGVFSYLGIFISFFSATLQGLTEFFKLSLLGVIATWSKLIFAVVLVLIGWKVFGAITALMLSSVVSVLVGYFVVRKYYSFNFSGRVKLGETFQGVKNYTFSVFVYHLSMTSIYTLDIILAKYFLSPFEAGQYAALSVLGKIVYFSSSPITSAMFPLISERYSKKEKIVGTFFQSFLLVFLISVFICSLYMIFPRQMISILYGKEYLVSTGLLGLFAVFISIYSLSAVFLNLFLSIARTKVVFVSLLAAVLQAVLIFIFHGNIRQIVSINIFSVSLLFSSLLVLFLIKQKKWISCQ